MGGGAGALSCQTPDTSTVPLAVSGLASVAGGYTALAFSPDARYLAALVVGVASSLLGLLLCAISGLRTSRPARSDSPAESGVG